MNFFFMNQEKFSVIQCVFTQVLLKFQFNFDILEKSGENKIGRRLIMKKSAASVFGRIFSKVLLGILVVVLVGVCAYQGVMRFTDYKINQNLKNEKENTEEDPNTQAADREKLISVLYTKNSGSKKFGDAILRMFHKDSREYRYVLIPAELSITLDDITYQQLQTESDTIPQTIVLKDIPDYFADSEEEYKAANRILKATFGLANIDFYENASLESLVSVINLIEPIELTKFCVKENKHWLEIK
jgi:hypothetical protein